MKHQACKLRAILAASAIALLLSSIPKTIAQTQPATPQPPDRAALLKVQPGLSGQRNGVFIQPDAIDFADHTGFVSLFDGKTLTGWDGRPGIWRVEDGAIVGETAAAMFEKWAFPNTFLIYRGVEAKDFDLKLEIKVEKGGGSGIQYRSSVGMPPGTPVGTAAAGRDPRWEMIGPQAVSGSRSTRRRKTTVASSTRRTLREALLRGVDRWCRRCPASFPTRRRYR